VIGGGAMLHRVPWPKSAPYADLIELYIKHIHSHFCNVHVVFDGYVNGPSTKDEHTPEEST
jgi:hypothetical protein